MYPTQLALMFLLVALVGGCASTAVRPPPATARVRFQDLGSPAPPGERYYALFFGSQSIPKVPRSTHTWVTTVRVRTFDAGRQAEMECHTISWLPATLQIRPWRGCVEPGVNLELHHTVKEMLANCERVSLWGPYEIRAGLYRKLLIQKAFLESGQVGYQSIDVVCEAGINGNGTNCIHAVTDADECLRRCNSPAWRYGEAASEHLVRQLADQGALVNPDRTHPWLVTALSLEAYPIHWRCR